jgi:hypothetical protein
VQEGIGMSAFILEKQHIDYMVSAAVTYGTIAEQDAVLVGQMLWTENHISVNFRYDEETPFPEYTCTPLNAPLDPVWVLAACRCYAYQTCEHDEWGDSGSKHFTDRLVEVAEKKLDLPLQMLQPSRYGKDLVAAVYQSDEYAEAPWGIGPEEWQQAREIASLK